MTDQSVSPVCGFYGYQKLFIHWCIRHIMALHWYRSAAATYAVTGLVRRIFTYMRSVYIAAGVVVVNFIT